MTTAIVPPGPDADEAFDLGVAATAAGSLVAIGALYFHGVLSPVAAVLAAVLAVPVVCIVAACLLGVWLGYDDDAFARAVANHPDRYAGRDATRR